MIEFVAPDTGQVFQVWWTHGETHHDKLGLRRTSVAQLRQNGSTHMEGKSICHPADNFRRYLGRKYALVDLLKGFSRHFRTVAWLACIDKCRMW